MHYPARRFGCNEKIMPIMRSPKGNVMGMTCGFRGMRSFCVYVAVLFVRHSGSAEGKSALARRDVPVF